jgi:hypothetical protein
MIFLLIHASLSSKLLAERVFGQSVFFHRARPILGSIKNNLHLIFINNRHGFIHER